MRSHWYDSTPEKSRLKRDSNPGSSALEALTTRPTRRYVTGETRESIPRVLRSRVRRHAAGPRTWWEDVCWLVACLTSQQHASVSQGRICTDNFTCCHTEIEATDPTFYLTQSQYTDTGPTSPSADPITPGAWQGSHWSANF